VPRIGIAFSVSLSESVTNLVLKVVPREWQHLVLGVARAAASITIACTASFLLHYSMRLLQADFLTFSEHAPENTVFL
jgi:hypothetical protein